MNFIAPPSFIPSAKRGGFDQTLFSKLSSRDFRGFCGSSKYWNLQYLKGGCFQKFVSWVRGFRGFRVFECEKRTTPGQKLKGSFYRGSFRMRGGSSHWCPWRSLGSGSGGWWGWVSFGQRGKRGRGWGGDRQRNRQVNAQALSKLPFSDLPLKKRPKLGQS